MMDEYDSLVSIFMNHKSVNELAHEYADMKLKIKKFESVIKASIRILEFLPNLEPVGAARRSAQVVAYWDFRLSLKELELLPERTFYDFDEKAK